MSSSLLFTKIRSVIGIHDNKDSHQEDLFLKTGAGYEKLNIKDLLFAKASEKHVELHFVSFTRIMRVSLAKFIQEDLRIELLRVHKSFAVNPGFINGFTTDEVIVGATKIPIGRIYKNEVMNHLKRSGYKP